MKVPERKKIVQVKSNSYELEINTGSLIDIELTKMSLTDGGYANLVKNSSLEALMARYNIDMMASFSVLAPKLVKDLKASSIANLDPVDGKLLLDIYVKEVSPWLVSWLTFQNSQEEDNTKDIYSEG